MATSADISSDSDIRRLNRESEKLEAETRKLMAEASKLNAEQLKLGAEQIKLTIDARISPWLLVVQATLGAAALMGAGGAFVKLFLS